MSFISRLFGKGKHEPQQTSFVYQIAGGFDECAECHRKVGPGQIYCPHCSSGSILSTEAHLAMRKKGKALVDAASELWRKGDRSQAIQKMRETTCVNPWNAVAHGNVGFFYAQMGKNEDEQFSTFEYLDRALVLGHPTPEPVRETLDSISSRHPLGSARFKLSGFFVFKQQDFARAALEAFPARICNVGKPSFVYRPLRESSPFDRVEAMSTIRMSLAREHSNAGTLEVDHAMTTSEIWYTLLHMRTAASLFEVITSDINSKRFNTFRDVLLSRRGVGYVQVLDQ